MGIERLPPRVGRTTEGRRPASVGGEPLARGGRPEPDEAPSGSATVDRAARARVLGEAASRLGGGTQGSRSAIAGLEAIAPRSVSTPWRAAVRGVVFGLALLGSVLPQARASDGAADPSTRAGITTSMPTGPPRQSPLVLRIAEQVEARRVATEDLEALATGGESASAPATGTSASMIREDTALQSARVPAELPQLIGRLSRGVDVVQGTDPGDFYCEHAFFTSTREARSHGSSILQNRLGEVLTGFLHSPADDFTYDAEKAPVQAERHADRREVVGAAIRGLFEEARPQLPDGSSFRLLLTGYGQWGPVVNNPTGDFVAHTENVDAAMAHAFGDALVDVTGKTMERSADGERSLLAYRVVDANTGRTATILVDAARLPVSDDAINGGERSLQSLIRQGRPHAVMSMGVAGGSTAYQAEFHADDGGLVERDGKILHDDAKQPTQAHPDNRSLGRAIQLGTQLLTRAAPGRV